MKAMTNAKAVLAGRVAVGLVGLGMLAAALTGRADLFVRGYFVPVVGLTGAALVALAPRMRMSVPRHAAMLLALPVLVGLGLGPAQASSIPAAPSGGQVGARLGDGSNPLLAGGGGQVTVLQIELAAQEDGPAALIGRRVSVEAEVATPTSVERLAMVCCAADARPVVLLVGGVHLPRQGTWVLVSGTLTVDNGQAALTADSARAIPVPSAPIL